MKKEGIYQVIILLMVICFMLFFSESHENFISLSATNDELLELVEKQRSDNDKVINQWEQNYSELYNDYVTLLQENYRLELSHNRVDIPVYEFTEEDVYLIAQCVEAEAGYYDGNELSQQYVTQVILNRLHSSQFPNSVEGVIYQKSGNVPQFSVAYNGMINREVESETLANVYSVLVHGTDLPEYILYFHSDGVSSSLNTYAVESGTVFAYRNKEDY